MEKKELSQQNSELKQQVINTESSLLFDNQLLQDELNKMKEKYKLLEEELALMNPTKGKRVLK